MKSKDITKQLLPGIVVGFVLGFLLTMVVGVNTENKIPHMKISKSATKLCVNNPIASPLTSENEIDLLD